MPRHPIPLAPFPLVLLALASLLPSNVGGCAAPIDPSPAGVTSGGPQDIAAARSSILGGALPDPDLITVEGFLAEHEIPLTPPADAGEIYASLGLAWRQPFLEPAAMAEVYVRLGTTISIADFARRPQNLVLVVDRSGSMDELAAFGDPRGKLAAVQQALHALLDQLTADDRVSMISFNNLPRLDANARSGAERDALTAAIDRLRAQGSTNLYAALSAGFERAVAASDPAARDDRVILFTDALPTAGTQELDDFVQLAEDFAGRGVGLTLMSVGAWFGDELADRLGRVPLANSYYLADAERIATIFDDEFAYLVMPAAHDLHLTITIPEGIGVRDVYGVANYVPGTRGAEVTIPTLFFSRREGGGVIIVRLTFAAAPDFAAPVAIGQVTLTYTPAAGTPCDSGTALALTPQKYAQTALALPCQRYTEAALTLPAGLAPSGDPAWYSDDAVRRAALLLDTALVLQEAAETAREGRAAVATEMIDDFLVEFDQRTLGLSDRTDPTARGLRDERDLLEALAGLAGSGGYYPWGF